MEIFAYEKCAHPIIIKNEMCGVCGEDLRKRLANFFLILTSFEKIMKSK